MYSTGFTKVTTIFRRQFYVQNSLRLKSRHENIANGIYTSYNQDCGGENQTELNMLNMSHVNIAR